MNQQGEPCPYAKHRPQTLEGAQAWDLVLKAGGQLRVGPMGGVVGFDMTAVMGMARALGYEERAMVELLAWAERGAVTALNQRMRENGGPERPDPP